MNPVNNLRAMSYCEERAAILTFGRIVERGFVQGEDIDPLHSRFPSSPGCIAVCNYLWVAAAQSRLFGLLLYRLIEQLALTQIERQCLPRCYWEILNDLRTYLKSFVLEGDELDRIATKLVELDHIIAAWRRDRLTARAFDPLTY